MDVRSVVQGRVVEIVVSPGDRVAEGDELVLVESMKMEVPVHAPRAGSVSAVMVAVGDPVDDGTLLVALD